MKKTEGVPEFGHVWKKRVVGGSVIYSRTIPPEIIKQMPKLESRTFMEKFFKDEK